jgi:hypothetical protein
MELFILIISNTFNLLFLKGPFSGKVLTERVNIMLILEMPNAFNVFNDKFSLHIILIEILCKIIFSFIFIKFILLVVYS